MAMFIEALFTRTKTWKQSKRPLMDKENVSYTDTHRNIIHA